MALVTLRPHMNSGGILVVDDDPSAMRLAQLLFAPLNVAVRGAHDGRSAIAEAERLRPDVVILDLGLPDISGQKVLDGLLAREPELPVVIVTGSGEVATAVRALQRGAFDYLVKPVDHDEYVLAVRRALDRTRLLVEMHGLRDEVNASHLESQMGPSEAVGQLAARVSQVAGSSMSVLVLGETGCGKELVAQAVHAGSPRREHPFVAVDCGAVPDALFESVLFGHEEGAFTGARGKRRGLMVEASGGTIFLDEVANLSLANQAKLLRALDERVVRPLGGQPTAVDVRLLAATNEKLEEQVRAQKFRHDLYYRLAEFVVRVPPLRERQEDIAHLANRFREQAATELSRSVSSFSGEALAMLRAHAWPGNVRELRNVVRQVVLACDGLTVHADHVAAALANGESPLSTPSSSPSNNGRSLRAIAEEAASSAERTAILEMLVSTQWNRAACARALQIDVKTLYRKMKQYGIDRRG